ncbi:ABC transporter substrate-binding protein [Herbaspirillum sp. RTI4]|uniref:MlaC/ttg2D family ABC transporter substrate-binding protein n=1 Tax=Herbaspirillum sp. RTI4 TaxID=3048640 RepID=UPI002AB47302|nr:ABC transporter substrate-binding protein [Herbaspirillum sp. RTI4]MDY7577740.1 ABC transporter substrate-binding protein [Herbaspirillum sp. RTI4]MEA9980832.1 ABC transporter substrate-binding protein [Herbaspirillum sp. RTI4]
MTFGAMAFAGTASAQEAPDALVKRIGNEVLAAAQADPEIRAGNIAHMTALVEQKILPYVDFERMTSLAAGRYWRDATAEQKKQLMTEFRSLLIFTYSGALAQVHDQKIEFKPMRNDPADTEVEVRSQIIQPRGEPIQLNYRLEKLPTGWKMFDINVLGAWLVETYKGTFAAEISKGGIDGLIATLSAKNKQLAARSAPKSK